MANAFYALGLDAFLAGAIDIGSDTIKVSLVSNGYSPALSTDQFYNVISGGNIVSAGVALSSKTTSGGTFSAGNTVWTSVTGSTVVYVPVYKDTGTTSTSPLIALFDSGTGIPLSPTGGDVTAAWSSGNLFTLCQALSEKDKRSFGARIRDFMEALGIPAMLRPGGLWIPKPTLILSPPKFAPAGSQIIVPGNPF